MSEILTLILLTLSPILELRASIPYGLFKTDLPLTSILLICTLSNIAVAPLFYFFLNYLVHFFLKINFINQYYQKTVLRTQEKVRPYIKKYGILGLALFIGIPLPGSGVYTGALGAYFLGFKFWDFFKATLLGVALAALLITLVSLSGSTLLSFLIRKF